MVPRWRAHPLLQKQRTEPDSFSTHPRQASITAKQHCRSSTLKGQLGEWRQSKTHIHAHCWTKVIQLSQSNWYKMQTTITKDNKKHKTEAYSQEHICQWYNYQACTHRPNMHHIMLAWSWQFNPKVNRPIKFTFYSNTSEKKKKKKNGKKKLHTEKAVHQCPEQVMTKKKYLVNALNEKWACKMLDDCTVYIFAF